MSDHGGRQLNLKVESPRTTVQTAVAMSERCVEGPEGFGRMAPDQIIQHAAQASDCGDGGRRSGSS